MEKVCYDAPMKRRYSFCMAVFCTVCFLLCAVRAASDDPFPDVTEDGWYYEAVTWLAGQGILNGFEDGTFRPDEKLTGAQLVKMILARELPEASAPEGEKWWKPYADRGLETGLLTEEDLAFMDIPTDRLRVARILARLPLLTAPEGFTVSPDRERILPAIGDREAIPAEDLEAVVAVYGSGLLQGYEDGCFHGERTLSRAEGATIIQRLCVPELRSPRLIYTPAETDLSGTLLLGNSHCGGLLAYGELDWPEIRYTLGGTVMGGLQTVCRGPEDLRCTMGECLRAKSYRRIILVYGTNEMGYDRGYVRAAFERFLDTVAELQPEAEVWLCTAPPVNGALIRTEGLTEENCKRINDMLADLAAKRGLGLLDVFPLFADESGSLAPEDTVDGIHLTADNYLRWARWLTRSFAGG